MKLTDLQPRWTSVEGVFVFLCPHCRATWLTCKNRPMGYKEQGALYEKEFGSDWNEQVILARPDTAWTISSGDFAKMTVKPSLDASASGHWHGHITKGAIVGGLT